MSEAELPHPLIPEPSRVRELLLAIMKGIPKVPNDRATKKVLEAKGLGDLFIDYMNWRARYVGVRERKVIIDPEMLRQPKWAEHAAAIEALFKKVERGEDLTPHLSLDPHTKGYAKRAGLVGASREDKWADKDFLLHGMNYHHFHLGRKVEKRGHIERTDDMLFAEVTRDEFRAVGIFDHGVFELGSPERHRLQRIRNRIAFRGKLPGVVMIDAAIQTSGHTLHTTPCIAPISCGISSRSLTIERLWNPCLRNQRSARRARRSSFGSFSTSISASTKSTAASLSSFSKGWN